MNRIALVCPDCQGRSALTDKADGVVCPKCGKLWPRIGGVVRFTEDRYWGEVPEDVVKSYMDEIRQKGFTEASGGFKIGQPRMYDFVFDASRADWRFAMDIKPTDHVLDAGCGMGAHTSALCDEVASVTSCDLSATRAEFVKLRAEADGKTNVTSYVANFMELPFAPGSFDVIVFNGLLEWVGKSEKFADPYDVQKWVMKRCYELLRPGGRLYVGIENRWAFAYFTGGRDHTWIRWTGIMPRWLSRPYCKWRLGEDYRTYTHGKVGYEKLFRHGGFEEVETMLVYPGYNAPRMLISFDDIKGLKYAIAHLMGGSGWKKRLMRYVSGIPGLLKAYRYGFYSFAIFGTKK